MWKFYEVSTNTENFVKIGARQIYNAKVSPVLGFVPSVLWRCWLGDGKGIRPVKTEWWGAGMVICLKRGADLHMARLMPLLLTVSCFSKIQIGFTFLVLAHLGSPGKGPLNGCVCVCWGPKYPPVHRWEQKLVWRSRLGAVCCPRGAKNLKIDPWHNTAACTLHNAGGNNQLNHYVTGVKMQMKYFIMKLLRLIALTDFRCVMYALYDEIYIHLGLLLYLPSHLLTAIFIMIKELAIL